MISRKWRTNWANLTPFFDYPPEIRKVMYTTNSIEAINSQLRKVTRKRGAFPTPESVRKVLYLAIRKASERWTRPVQDWPAALNHLDLVFPGRERLISQQKAVYTEIGHRLFAWFRVTHHLPHGSYARSA